MQKYLLLIVFNLLFLITPTVTLGKNSETGKRMYKSGNDICHVG